ncbi:MAG: DUF4395 domain-containing protein [Candidatus Kariarchaeaceae archaeon]|jgi:hypothetical protein
MITYPPTLDENISRPIATTVFTIGLITLLKPEFNWLVIPLFLDFTLRYLHPKFSPLVWITKLISKDILHNKTIPYFSPPKRFAVLIGSIITGLMTISYILQLSLFQMILTIILLIAANLQGFFGYCIGCKLHDYLVKVGFIPQNKSIGFPVK